MSAISLWLNNPLGEERYSSDDLFDRHFGLDLGPREIIDALTSHRCPSIPSLCVGNVRPRRFRPEERLGISKIKSDENEFNVRLDVHHFKPEELKVKLDDSGFLTVEGEHEERSDDHGFISRQFKRRYKLPEDVQQETLKSKLSSDGILSLTAAKKPTKRKAEREIEIIRSNAPLLGPTVANTMENGSVAKKKCTEQNSTSH
uniref:Heat shock protein 20-3 n=1 Tax=Cyrtorhinus lividipennis TaxID=1032904 RepID=A0A346THN1_9HEMI|nr:heat shock protein 20-3 [Cyrtorhinus lividipennis]